MNPFTHCRRRYAFISTRVRSDSWNATRKDCWSSTARNGKLTKCAAATKASPTVDKVSKVAIDEVSISPAKKLRDGSATKPDFCIVGENEDDGLGKFVDEEIRPALSLGELESGR